MACSPARLVVFAQLSAIEEDLRLAINAKLGSHDSFAIMSETLATSALARLQVERGRAGAQSTEVSVLSSYVDFGDLIALVNTHRDDLDPEWKDCLESFNSRLQKLLPVRKRIAHVRPLDYEDFVLVDSTAKELIAHHQSIWPSLTEIAAALEDPSQLLNLPQPPAIPIESGVLHNLPLPDYDDTGFLGRAQELRTILQLLRGPYPVVSIIGEGGLGKTALAVRAAYELADSADEPFEAVIFTTSKSSFLTPSEIRMIDDQVKTSLGVLTAASAELGSSSEGENAIDDLLFAMENYRILLVIDNLENVIDETIRTFFDRLPNGSKVLVTSRIGLGDYEKKLLLPTMSNNDAGRLLRTYARLSGVEQIARLEQDKIESLCSRMEKNPLWIKWLVTAVLAGSQPEEVLRNSDVFLDYCLSNVYGYLSRSSQRALEVLQHVPQKVTLAELNHYQGTSVQDSQTCLQELRTTNMIDMEIAQQGATCEARFGLTQLSLMYLQRHHPLSTKRQRELASLSQGLEDIQKRTLRRLAGASPTDPRNFVRRSKNDLIVVKLLRDAQNHADQHEYAEALEVAEKARQLAPDYFECLRVAAQIQAQLNDLTQARNSFCTAIDMEPAAASLRYYYATFLWKQLGDTAEASEQISIALKVDPNAIFLNELAARLALKLWSLVAPNSVWTLAWRSILPVRRPRSSFSPTDVEAAELHLLCTRDTRSPCRCE